MTVRAFLTTFQSLLSLMEETLAHWPWGKAEGGYARCCAPRWRWPCPPAPHLHQVQVALRVPFQAQPAQQLLLAAFQQLVEDVEVPLPVVLVHHPGLLQQVTEDVAAHRRTLWPGQDVAAVQGAWGWAPASPLSSALLVSNPSAATSCVDSGKSPPPASVSSSKKRGHAPPSTWLLPSAVQRTGGSHQRARS